MRRFPWLPITVPAAVFAIYLLTLRPTVGWIDCGEVTTGAYLLNVLHPTGYPLYTLIGHIFTLIPIGRVVVRMNVLSALASAFAAMFCCLTVARLTRSRVAGIITAALYAFSYTGWSNSVESSSYPLTALYVALTIYLMVRLKTCLIF